MSRKRLVVGISGASAPIYGIRLLELLRKVPDVETHLVYTRAALRTLELETDYTPSRLAESADVSYGVEDWAGAVSSGSFQTEGMIVAPCSISTMSCIAASICKDLLTRVADVTLKERRPLVLMVRESPLHEGHLSRMLELARRGAVIAPPIPSFYHRPSDIGDLIDHNLGRALEVFGFELPWLRRWAGPDSER